MAAPAGFGKTTLAREWLGERDDVAWCSGRESLGELDTVAHAELRSAWLVVDDHDAAPGCADLVESLLARSSCRLLVAARRRPRWLTARRLVHGEALLLDSQELAFTESEVEAVVGNTPLGAAAALVRAASGWPALVALAARSAEAGSDAVRNALAEYLAQEVVGVEVRELAHVVDAATLTAPEDGRARHRSLRVPDHAARRLTPREHEVLELMSQGLGNAEIARRLFISEKTAKAHASHLFEKLGVRSRVQAVIAAGRAGEPGAAVARPA